jgi:hypothetical protein
MNPVLRTTLWVGVGLALAATTLALMLLWLLFGAAQGGIDIRVNGQPLVLPEWPPFWQEWPAAMGAGAALLDALLLAVAVPVILLTALALGALGALGGAAGIAGVFLAVGLVALLVLSPVWLPLLLVWLLLRRRRSTPALQA